MSPAELEELTKQIRPMPRAKHEVDCFLTYIETELGIYEQEYGLELVPDFQRGHKWTQEQQEHFVESVIRGAITTAGLLIQFNCPSLEQSTKVGDLPRTMQCVDGLQRLTALRRYVAGEIKAFGRYAAELEKTPFDARRYNIRIAMHSFQTRVELLQYYLDLNAGGTPHAPEELDRVRALLAEELAKQNA